MTDATLRTLERTWLRTGAPLDGVAWLQARVRHGELSRARLGLAAHAGHALARRAAGLDRPPPPLATSGKQLLRWVRRLEHFGPEAHVLALVTAVRQVLPARGETSGPITLRAAEAWLACPCAAHAQAAAQVAGLRQDEQLPRRIRDAAWACAAAAGRAAALQRVTRLAVFAAGEALPVVARVWAVCGSCARVKVRAEVTHPRCPSCGTRPLEQAPPELNPWVALQGSIRSALQAWALGEVSRPGDHLALALPGEPAPERAAPRPGEPSVALGPPRVLLRGADVALRPRATRTRCAWCHGGLERGAVAYVACGTRRHADCAALDPRSPTLGCRASARPRTG